MKYLRLNSILFVIIAISFVACDNPKKCIDSEISYIEYNSTKKLEFYSGTKKLICEIENLLASGIGTPNSFNEFKSNINMLSSGLNTLKEKCIEIETYSDESKLILTDLSSVLSEFSTQLSQLLYLFGKTIEIENNTPDFGDYVDDFWKSLGTDFDSYQARTAIKKEIDELSNQIDVLDLELKHIFKRLDLTGANIRNDIVRDIKSINCMNGMFAKSMINEDFINECYSDFSYAIKRNMDLTNQELTDCQKEALNDFYNSLELRENFYALFEKEK